MASFKDEENQILRVLGSAAPAEVTSAWPARSCLFSSPFHIFIFKNTLFSAENKLLSLLEKKNLCKKVEGYESLGFSSLSAVMSWATL